MATSMRNLGAAVMTPKLQVNRQPRFEIESPEVIESASTGTGDMSWAIRLLPKYRHMPGIPA